jgi:hypothetical protein
MGNAPRFSMQNGDLINIYKHEQSTKLKTYWLDFFRTLDQVGFGIIRMLCGKTNGKISSDSMVEIADRIATLNWGTKFIIKQY